MFQWLNSLHDHFLKEIKLHSKGYFITASMLGWYWVGSIRRNFLQYPNATPIIFNICQRGDQKSPGGGAICKELSPVGLDQSFGLSWVSLPPGGVIMCWMPSKGGTNGKDNWPSFLVETAYGSPVGRDCSVYRQWYDSWAWRVGCLLRF